VGRLIVVSTDEAAPGYRLAGVATEVVADAKEATRVIADLIADGAEGVIAVEEPLFSAIDARTRRGLEDSANPVIVALPSGAALTGPGRRARLAAMLRRAIGYRITFGAEGTA
jgi:vacuolar-type H+-ATPase subunit F/Vma7